MTIEIREADPADVDAAVPLIYSSGPATFDYVFSHRTHVDAQEFLRRAFVTGRGEFGYQHHYVSTLDGEVVATGACFTGKVAVAHTVAALRQILGAYGLVSGIGVIRRGLQVEQVVQPPRGNLHYIAHLGVRPELRGQGIGTRLLEHLLKLGRERRRTVAALDVAETNPRAQSLYEKTGFWVVREVESTLANETATVANHRRMERPLA